MRDGPSWAGRGGPGKCRGGPGCGRSRHPPPPARTARKFQTFQPKWRPRACGERVPPLHVTGPGGRPIRARLGSGPVPQPAGRGGRRQGERSPPALKGRWPLRPGPSARPAGTGAAPASRAPVAESPAPRSAQPISDGQTAAYSLPPAEAARPRLPSALIAPRCGGAPLPSTTPGAAGLYPGRAGQPQVRQQS